VAERPELRDAFAALVREALETRRRHYGEPIVIEGPSLGVEWSRADQMRFVRATRMTYTGLPQGPRYRNVDQLDSYQPLRAALEADPWIGGQFDKLVGSAFHRSRMQLELIVAIDLLEPLIVHTGSFEFDEDRFEELYDRIEADLLSDRVIHVTWVPLLGIDPTAEVSRIELGDGWELRPMTDHELSLSIDFGTVPNRPETPPIMEARWVSLFDQWALAKEWSLPKAIGDEYAAEEDFGAVMGLGAVAVLAERLVTALRVVAGGVVCAGAAAQSDKPTIHGGRGGSYSRRFVARPQDAAPCVLDASKVSVVQDLWNQLAVPGVEADKALGIALRRLRDAPLRPGFEDRLIDLIIAAEALFLTDAGNAEDRGELSYRLALRAALFISDPPRSRSQILTFFRRAYRARSAVVHGSQPRRLRNLEGSNASAENVVEDLERLMRLALHQAVNIKGGSQASTLYDWDALITSTLDARPQAALRIFQDDDAGYLAWIHQHPDGFVANAARRPAAKYLILHRATCTYITRATQQGRWTVAYIKVCAPEVAELDRWASMAVGGRLRACRWCAPGP
jgi:hypothetical protein